MKRHLAKFKAVFAKSRLSGFEWAVLSLVLMFGSYSIVDPDSELRQIADAIFNA